MRTALHMPLAFVWAGAACAAAQGWPAATATCSGIDGLGRVLPTAAECRAPRIDRAVVLFYFLWHGAHGYDEHRQPPPDGGVWPKDARAYRSPFDLTRILAEARASGEPPAFGPEHAFHHWGEPHLGYYLADDVAVLRRHALWFVDAGIDALAIDVTNALPYSANWRRLFDVYAALRRDGVPVPRLLFLANAGAEHVVGSLWRDLYAPGLHRELWFPWRGKPLLLAPPEALTAEQAAFFTVRQSWAWSAAPWFGDGRDKWPWLDHHPQRWGWHDHPDRPEAMAVAVAQHPTTNIGRSFHDGRQPPAVEQVPARGPCFAEQWERALAVDPEAVFVTGWNEWTAMRFLAQEPGTFAGAPLAKGDSFFVDLWSQEYSRDIEPMRGGHEDAFYWQLVAAVRRYKGVPEVPRAGAPRSLALDAPAAAWDTVQPAFVDHRGDTFERDHPGYGAAGPYRQPAAANDLVLAKVAHDRTTLTCLLRAAAPLVLSGGDAAALRLHVDADADPTTGSEGFEFVVDVGGGPPGTAVVSRCLPAGDERSGEVPCRVAGTDVVVALPRRMLGLAGAPLRFDFQWVAGVPPGAPPVTRLDRGDSAPDGRFRYCFRE